jgi:hypothetical protein
VEGAVEVPLVEEVDRRRPGGGGCHLAHRGVPAEDFGVELCRPGGI